VIPQDAKEELNFNYWICKFCDMFAPLYIVADYQVSEATTTRKSNEPRGSHNGHYLKVLLRM
jgi:hypothetical protein